MNKSRTPSIAHINEAECIGCTKCIQACPVDAIIGSDQQMHVVIKQECIGCELCVAPCPVDCIDMLSVNKILFDRKKVRQRFHARKNRLVTNEQALTEHYRKVKILDNLPEQDKMAKLDYIKAAKERVKAKK